MKDANLKPFTINIKLLYEAFKRVKSKHGSAGIDEVTIDEYELELDSNVYKLWNRMSSGTYFPKPVKQVEIPKSNGGKRPLGIPIVEDRIAQTVVAKLIEPELERIFHPDSYGYRPNRSMHDALEKAKQMCWKYAWVLDMDISKFFDTIDHKLLMKAVRKHVKEKWMLLYIERWLKVPYQTSSGKLIERTMGVPQGSVIGPILANLFLHYCFDDWMRRKHPEVQFERFADDTICHFKTLREAEVLYNELQERFAQCKLSLNTDKTKIVYCKDSNRPNEYPEITFDFLGHTFRSRKAYNQKQKKAFSGFMPAISSKAKKKIRETIKSWELKKETYLPIEAIAIRVNPKLRGWDNYYGANTRSEFIRIFYDFNYTLLKWVRAKYKCFRNSLKKAVKWLKQLARRTNMFYHWSKGIYP